MTPSSLLSAFASLTLVLALSSCGSTDVAAERVSSNGSSEDSAGILVQYLEIVTPSVDATCSALEKMHDVTFGEPDAGLGSARTATLKGGGKIGVRAPMAEHDLPVVRPYLLVDDIEAAVGAAEEAGAMIAMAPTEIPGQGRFAIYFLEGTQFGLWQH